MSTTERALPGLSLATVVYSKELPLLRLQARSLARYGDPSTIRQILIAINDRDEAGVRRVVETLVPLYGVLSDRVTVLRSEELFHWDGLRTPADRWTRLISRPELSLLLRLRRLGWGGYDGWLMQQAFKLAVARMIREDFAIILDAKNVFVRRFDPANFIGKSGLPLTQFHDLAEKSRRWLNSSARALGIDEPLHPAKITRYVTPFCVESDVLRQTLVAVEKASGPVQCAFANRRPHPTEFMLINAWAEHFGGGILGRFEDGFTGFENLSVASPMEAFDRAVQRVAERSSFGISPHAGLVARLTEDRLRRLVELLVEAQIGNEREILSEIESIKSLNEHRKKMGQSRLKGE